MKTQTRTRKPVRTPLGFYALTLLIVEGFLGTVIVATDLPSGIKILGIWTGAALFLLVILIVTLLTWFKPTNLMYDQYGHLVESGHRAPFGDNGKEMDSAEVAGLPMTKETS
ncbi:MAG: hypothetical protein ACE5HZ_08770 [Fidelibacterota bacterium]